MATFGFPLGEPPRDDVEAAARLLLQYEREAPLNPDRVSMFLQMCQRPGEVVRRSAELRSASKSV